ncbi:MAG: oxalate:formate antiporter [Methanomicrobium sp.]|nr:oxalate:formate antiporter [Methanomicrobium sp.]
MNSKNSHKDISRLEGCTVIGALTVTSFVTDAATIVHGPAGCAHQSASMIQSSMLYNECYDIPEIFTSAMSEEEIIFGGEERLRDTIRETVAGGRYKAVFVIGTCISDTIGDDTGIVCDNASAEYNIPVIPIDASGFLGGSFEKGFISAIKGVSELIPPIPPRMTEATGIHAEPEPKPKTVNIIAEKNLEYEVDSNFAEVKRLLSLLGADINIRMARRTTVADIARFNNAALNIIRDDPTGAISAHLKSVSDIPTIERFPAGLSGTIEFLKTAGRLMNLDEKVIEDAVNAELKNQNEMLAKFADLKGKKISFDYFGFQKADSALLDEIAERAGLRIDIDGAVITVPFYTPVGTAGVKQMLIQWRRFINGKR